MNATQLIASYLYALAIAGDGALPEHDNGRKFLYCLAQGWDSAAWEFQYGDIATLIN